MIYEVKKFGVSLTWTSDLREAEVAFKEANPGEVFLYQIVGTKKTAIKRK